MMKNEEDPLIHNVERERRRRIEPWIAVSTMFIALLATLAVAITFAILYSQEKASSSSSSSSQNWKKAEQGFYERAAVATDVPYCSEMASNVLQFQGGNAADATVVAALCIGILSPGASGTGGGGVVLIRLNNSQTPSVIDCRETAPANATRDMFVGNPEAARRGVLSAGVPGEWHCLAELHRRHGQLEWSSLVTQVAQLARNFTVDAYLARQLSANRVGLARDAYLHDLFFDAASGEPKGAGDTVQWTELAKTFDAIAAQGIGALYNGSAGEALVADMRAAGGIITMDDLRSYAPVDREPLSTFFMGMEVLGAPLPFAGSVFLMALNLLERYDVGSMDWHSAEAQHYMIESWLFAYGDRMQLGDPAFVPGALGSQALMISKRHAAKLRQRIVADRTFAPEHYVDLYNLTAPPDDHGTSHVSIVDTLGNAVAMTTTINLGFGSQWASPSTGMLLNDELDDFSTPNMTNFFGYPPSPNNYIVPNKRPLSSMSPTIVLDDDRLKLVAGGSGGSKIITATFQTLLNTLAYAMDAGTAVGAPRLHDQLLPDKLSVEDAFPEPLVAQLAAMGYNISHDGTLANVQAILINNASSLNAASDWRKDGAPFGF
jgi:gamma-glutamyltranspeptidase / glutathione hydrolase / leukotriene-C4 hydrolase